MKVHQSLIFLILLFLKSFVIGQSNYLYNFDPDSLRFKIVKATRCSSPPKIDGVLNDYSWEGGYLIDEFFQIEPKELIAPSEKTAVKLKYDNEALYVFIQSYDSQPDKIRKTLVRRDSWMDGFANNSDWVGITIDSRNDDYNGYFFAVNASGAKMDVVASGEWNFDPTWNPVWDVSIGFNDEGWTAEFKLPFAIFQFENKPNMEWGISFERAIHRLQERVEWPGRSKSIRGLMLPLGILQGFNDVPNPKQLEIVPYVLAGYSDNIQSDIGLDLRYGLTSNSMMKITVNPDFGQVEADPSVLNLTAFETFYEEKRPFFSEGSEFFDHRISLFNSRRIGKKPGYYIPEDTEIKDMPDFTTILTAGKIMGSSSSGMNYGLITAMTAEETAISIDGLDSSKIVVEPRTNYSIGRLEIPLINKISRVGLMITNVSRRNQPGATVLGLDWRIGLFDNKLFSNGQIIQSNVNQVIGDAYRFNFGYLNPLWWSIRFWYGTYDDRFDTNDLGYLRRNGLSYAGSRLELRIQEPWGHFIRNNLELKYTQEWNSDGLLLEREVEVEQENLLSNYWNIGLFSKLFLPAFNDEDIFRNENAWEYKTEFWGYAGPSFSSDRRKNLVFGANLGAGYGRNRGTGYRIEFWSKFKPIEPLNIEMNIKQDKSPNYMQWVDVLENIGDTVRVYANSLLLTRDITLRLDWTFSPQMSFQCFLQPFFADMDYKNYFRLETPRTMDLIEYEYLANNDNPDFKILNTVGTFVLRWEYREGSTIFIVYNLNESSDYSSSESLWSRQTENAIFFKINYWLKN